MNRFQSLNPATQDIIWEGEVSDISAVDEAVRHARRAFPAWVEMGFDQRLNILNQYQKLLERDQIKMAQAISDEVGKPYWEAKTEVTTMLAKLAIAVSAYHDRTPVRQLEIPGARLNTRHRPHGVMGVIGPFNFPGHLPTGHIIPSLLAGNTVVFKPSEFTPYVGEIIFDLFNEAGLPEGVLNVIQGAGETGKKLVAHPELNGLLFTGSYATGKKIHEQFAGFPEKILALEMGGNNPLVVDEVKDLKAAILTIIQSAYISAGQRCSCARRLIIPKGAWGDHLIEQLARAVKKIRVDFPDASPQPFISTLISATAGEHVLKKQEEWLSLGAKSIVKATSLFNNTAILSPGLLEATGISCPDEEVFGPLLKIIRVKDMKEALVEANNTQYGLSSGIITDDQKQFDYFYDHIRAGLVTWNKPTTGSSGLAPFGGLGHSGNHRPSAYYAADYSAYPCVSTEASLLKLPEQLPEGIYL